MLIRNNGEGRLGLSTGNIEVGETLNIKSKEARRLLSTPSYKVEAIEYKNYKATEKQCPICFLTLESAAQPASMDSYNYHCSRCGGFLMSSTMRCSNPGYSEENRAYLSYRIRRGLNDLKTDEVRDIINDPNIALISLKEQINNFILYLLDKSKDVGSLIGLNLLEIEAIMGTNNINTSDITVSQSTNPVKYGGYGSAYCVLKHLEEKRFVDIESILPNNFINLTLTVEGFNYCEQLKKSEVNSNVAFFAFQFPKKTYSDSKCDKDLEKLDEELKEFYEECKLQMGSIGIKLSNPLLEDAKNGNICNRLEMEIIKSKFIVSDLSHDNPGAYWEAGFAHGMNKKVFYTCKDGTNTHFDTSQHNTIFWDKDNIKSSASDLKDTIERSFIDLS
jgi:hypothetical protein